MTLSLFRDEFKEIKKASEPLYKTPKSIQETIEISKVSKSGNFEIGKETFSKSYYIQDINYVTEDDGTKTDILETYCKFLNTLEVPFKITINNKSRDVVFMKEKVLYKKREQKDYKGLESYYNPFNHHIESKVNEGRRGVDQQKYLTITVKRKNYEEAKLYFDTIDTALHQCFMELKSRITAINGNERLKIIHDFYRKGEEASATFDIEDYLKNGSDFKNDICNTQKTEYGDYDFKIDDRYGKALFIQKYSNGLDEQFLMEVSNLPIHSMISVDIVPISKELTGRVLERKYLGIENDIAKQQKVRNKNNDFSSDISYKKRLEKKEIEDLMDEFNENDQKLFFVGVTIIIMSEAKETLQSMKHSIMNIARGAGCRVEEHYLKQREAINTALPIGVRQVDTMRSMFTRSCCALLPFRIQELVKENGIFYGINQVSKQVIQGNRKELTNGNGFIFGVPGAGKSVCGKAEITSVLLNTNDDVIVVDPTHEYYVLADEYNGEVVEMSVKTKNHLNPMEIDFDDIETIGEQIAEKCEFMHSVYERCEPGESMSSRHRSIISRCTQGMYEEKILNRDFTQPTMGDIYNRIKEQEEDLARDIALSLEDFIKGPLNIFNYPTNVDTKNRFIVYGIRDLGESMAPLAMLVMLEQISYRIAMNAKKGIATWLYIDEFHVVIDEEHSAKYFYTLWKKVRKLGGLCTGLTQNITDLLQNDTTKTMLSNSEFVMLLKQSKTDAEDLCEVLRNVTESQLRYVNGSPSGTGIIKHGEVVVPFDNTMEKSNKLYKLFNTNLHEQAMMKQKEMAQ